MSSPTPKALRLQEQDDVAVAITAIGTGLEVMPGQGPPVTARDTIPAGHKIAIHDIAAGQPVRKYGQVIGFARGPIAAGSHVHTHNLGADQFTRQSTGSAGGVWMPPPVEPRTFDGYRRVDGRVGTRNMIAVISTVNCSASVSRLVSDRFRDGAWRAEFPHVDGIFAITHKGGCGLPFGGPDQQILERVLAGFARHPNVAAYVLVGLGCEMNYASHLVESQDLVVLAGMQSGRGGGGDRAVAARPLVLNIQDEGGISRTVEAAVAAVTRLLPEANHWRRSPQPASALCLGLECGGSDGNSGITANPALGVAADLVVAQGGTAILAETTEIYGAEHLLAQRAIRPEIRQKLMDKIAWWERYTGQHGAQIDNNPSPGNKAGGLTTIYEKSLGALAKGGSSPLVDVVDFAEAVHTPGLVFMDTPGYDPVCTTGLVAGGSNVLVFTTGRGSVLGLRPCPCIKVATNTPLYERMSDDMDLDAGPVLAGVPVETMGRTLFEQILEVASGRPTQSERMGVGEEEFAPWQIGPTL